MLDTLRQITNTPEVGAFLGLVINALVLTLITVLTPIVKRFVETKLEQAKIALGSERMALIQSAAAIAVQYAEQAGLKGLIEDTAENKLNLASAAITDIAKQWGIVGLSTAEWRTAIEAALREGVHKRPELIGSIVSPDVIPPTPDTKYVSAVQVLPSTDTIPQS